MKVIFFFFFFFLKFRNKIEENLKSWYESKTYVELISVNVTSSLLHKCVGSTLRIPVFIFIYYYFLLFSTSLGTAIKK